MRKAILFSLIAALGFTSASAKKYIAAVGGTSGGAGTLASPYDIPTAISKALAGDTVYIRAGQYMMTAQMSLSRGGNSTSYINIWAYPGDERPVLDFYNRGYSGTNAASERGVSVSKDYYFIQGLDITRAGDNGMHIQSSYNKIQNCRFYKNCDAGMQITGGTGGYNQIIDCDAHDNFDFKSSPVGGNADGFACKLTVGVGNKFIRCRSWNNSDDGYDCYGSQNDIYFEDCWVMSNGQKNYDVTDYPGGSTGIVTNAGNGNGFKVGGNAAVGGATLIRCISTGHKIMSSSNKGFDQNNSVGKVLCYNCISYNDGRAYSFPNNTDARGAHIFANNIALGAGNSNSFHSSTIFKTNTWNGITVSAADFESLLIENSKLARNTDGSLPAMDGLFHLVKTSGLINTGTDVSLPYFGTAPDLGPFEFNGLTSVIIPSGGSDISVRYSSVNREICIQGSIHSAEVLLLNGEKIYSQQTLSDRLSIKTDNWTKGIYLVRMISQSGNASIQKILVD